MAQFSFELRYYDAKQAMDNNRPEYYTKKFLDYKVFTSPIWQSILTSNQWMKPPGEDEFRMVVDPKVSYKINLNKYILRCQDKNFKDKMQSVETPFVVNKPDPDVVQDQEKIKGFWGKLKAFYNAPNKKEFINT